VSALIKALKTLTECAVPRSINGLPAEQRQAVRRERSVPLVAALEAWMREERCKLSRHAEVAGAMDDMLKRWASFSRPGCLRCRAREANSNALPLLVERVLFACKGW
jgi:Transposase IS66 family